MANTPFTILTTKNVPIDLTSKDFLKFTQGIKIGDKTLVDSNGVIPFERISSTEGFVAIVTRISNIENAIGTEETEGTILKRISVLESFKTATETSLNSLNGRITANSNDISALATRVTANEGSISNINSAIGDATNPAEGTIRKRLNAIEESIGGASGDIATRLSAVETKASTNETNIAKNTGDIATANGKIATLETDTGDLKTRMTTVEGKASTNETEIGGLKTRMTTAEGDISTIKGVIPAEASTTNKLADKNFVNSSIQTATAYFDGNWANFAAVPSTEAGFSDASLPVPGPNNYLVVIADEGHSNQTWRYKYTGKEGEAYAKSKWVAEYKINDTALTQAQLEALNSGITSALVGQISTNATDIAGLKTRMTTVEGKASANETEISGLKTRMTTVEGKASANETAITTINSTIGADDTTGLRKRIKDVETAVGADDTTGLRKRVKDIEDVVPYAATPQNELADKKFVTDADAVLQGNIDAINFLNLPATFKVGNRRYQITINESDDLIMTRLEDAV